MAGLSDGDSPHPRLGRREEHGQDGDVAEARTGNTANQRIIAHVARRMGINYPTMPLAVYLGFETDYRTGRLVWNPVGNSKSLGTPERLILPSAFTVREVCISPTLNHAELEPYAQLLSMITVNIRY